MIWHVWVKENQPLIHYIPMKHLSKSKSNKKKLRLCCHFCMTLKYKMLLVGSVMVEREPEQHFIG